MLQDFKPKSTFFKSQLISAILPDDIKLAPSEPIAVSSFNYLEALNTLICNTEERTLINYVIWRIIEAHSGFVGIPNLFLNGTASRADKCFNFSFHHLRLSVNAEWLRKYFNIETKTEVESIVTAIKLELKEVLKSVEWFDGPTREAALQKLDSMMSLVAFPDELLDNEKLTEVYENITVDESKLLETFLKLSKSEAEGTFRMIRKPNFKSDWTINSFVARVNAFYYPGENVFRELNLKVRIKFTFILRFRSACWLFARLHL
jgi:predicted metalloendopeptidase